MVARIHFSGPARYRLRSAIQAGESIVEASLHRLVHGPRRPGWNWCMELATQALKRRVVTAFEMRDVTEARRSLDSVVIVSPALAEVNIMPVVRERVRGSWFVPKNTQPWVTVLYLHGGGYSFYPQAYSSFIAMITVAAKTRLFALDYRLSPEHRFPAQLDDALDAYRWLLENGAHPENLVIAGDSAGGNLTLTLLLAVRDAKLPQPALAIALSPAIDLETEYPSMAGNQEFDWINQRAVLQWADWFCDSSQRCNPLISPLRADLRGLPPIYIQAGRCEILYDSIQAFADCARSQRTDVVLEAWEDMNHVFQILGEDVPQSAEALRRIGEVIDLRVRLPQSREAVSATDR